MRVDRPVRGTGRPEGLPHGRPHRRRHAADKKNRHEGGGMSASEPGCQSRLPGISGNGFTIPGFLVWCQGVVHFLCGNGKQVGFAVVIPGQNIFPGGVIHAKVD